jgi:hypothetical protein
MMSSFGRVPVKREGTLRKDFSLSHRPENNGATLQKRLAGAKLLRIL